MLQQKALLLSFPEVTPWLDADGLIPEASETSSVGGARSGERRIAEATAGDRSAHTQVTGAGSGPEADYLHLHLLHPTEGGGVSPAASLGQVCTAFGTTWLCSGIRHILRERLWVGTGQLGACREVGWGPRPGPG